MKISINQLRKIIKEEVTNVTQAKKKANKKKPILTDHDLFAKYPGSYEAFAEMYSTYWTAAEDMSLEDFMNSNRWGELNADKEYGLTYNDETANFVWNPETKEWED